MATVKITLRKLVNKDGSSPLVMRITKDRKTSTIHLGYHVLASDWDPTKQRVKKSHPNSVRLNNLLIKKIAEASDKAIELETNHANVSSKTMMKKVKPNSGTSFFKQADIYLATLKEAGKYNRYTADKPRIRHFRDFMDGSDITFPDITESLLKQFRHYLHTKLEISERTILNHFVVIRSVFSQAIQEGAIETKYYPFGKGKISIKFPESNKVGLSVEDVKRLEAVHLPNSNYHHARNLWLISFYFAGMRVSDLLRLKWSDFKKDRLYYTMGKNLKPGSLKVPKKALAILEQYKMDKQGKDDLIFPELKTLADLSNKFIVQRRIAFTASRIDKFLREQVAPQAEITHKLTMHIARHTFGNISGDKIPVQMLQKLYRHSDIKTTIGYQSNFINKDADDALDAVVEF